MQETITRPKSIAEIIRDSRGPSGEMADLAGKASRLFASIKVADKWMQAAMNEGPTEMTAQAERIYDELEEELARVVWQAEVLEELAREKAANERHPEGEKVKDVEAVSRNAALANTLLEAYCVLSSVPEEYLGIGGSEASARTRYKLMGALLTAGEAANDEIARYAE